MEKLRCMIIDDSASDIHVLDTYMGRIPQLLPVARASTAQEGQKRLLKGDIDLLFLDVQMPGMDGLDLLASLERPPAFILCTAYESFAVRGFELEAMDYLVKPVSFQRFALSVHRAIKRLGLQKSLGIPMPETVKNDYIIVQNDYSRLMTKIYVMDISFVEVSDSVCTFFMVADQRTIEVRKSLKAIMSILDEKMLSGLFMRIGRQQIVAVEGIYRVYKNKLWMTGWEDRPLLINERYVETVNRRFLGEGPSSADKEV